TYVTDICRGLRGTAVDITHAPPAPSLRQHRCPPHRVTPPWEDLPGHPAAPAARRSLHAPLEATTRTKAGPPCPPPPPSLRRPARGGIEIRVTGSPGLGRTYQGIQPPPPRAGDGMPSGRPLPGRKQAHRAHHPRPRVVAGPCADAVRDALRAEAAGGDGPAPRRRGRPRGR